MPAEVAEGFLYLLRKHDEVPISNQEDPDVAAYQAQVYMRLRQASGM